MNELGHQPKPAWFRRNWVLVAAVLLTLGWAMVAYFMLSSSAPCRVDEKVVGFLECRSSNEVGDLLAGLFSPVAFVWLVAAVVMQSSELRAQREELCLTRREYELTRLEVEAQRKALESQVVEARRNVELIGEQTALFVKQQSAADMRLVDQTIDGFVEIIGDLFSRIAGNTILHTRLNNGGTGSVKLPERTTETYSHYIKKSVASFDTQVTKFIGYQGKQSVTKAFTTDLGDILDAMQEITKLREGASHPKRFQIDVLDFERMGRAFEKFKAIEKIPET